MFAAQNILPRSWLDWKLCLCVFGGLTVCIWDDAEVANFFYFHIRRLTYVVKVEHNISY